jgi:hypothetical protein
LEASFLNLLDVAERIANGPRTEVLRLEMPGSLPAFYRDHMDAPAPCEVLAGQVGLLSHGRNGFTHLRVGY